jgi:prolipoprotein diacylglyceryltransferase
MFPVIAAFGPITISSLGVLIALAFFLGGFGVWRKMREEHFEDEDIFDVIFLSFFSGMIGSRIFYILFHFDKFGFNFKKWLNLAYSNQFSWLGFLLGMMYMVHMLARRKKWDYWKAIDLTVWGVIVAQVLVRIGQFLDGSYVGIETNSVLGLDFPGIGKRFPINVFEAVTFLLVFYLMKWLDKHYRLYKWYQTKKGEAQPGFLWLSYLFIFALFHFSIDFFIDRNILFLVFSSYQMFMLGFLGLILFWFWLRAGNKLRLFETKQVKVIRPASKTPISQIGGRTRKRRFTRARAGKDVR